MRVACVLLVALAAAGAADAQLLWVGGGASKSWEYDPVSEPDRSWLGSSGLNPTLFVGVPLADDTLVRLRAFDLPYRAPVGETVSDAHLRGVTAAVDYFFKGPLGETAFSAGIGSYQLDLSGVAPPPGVEGWEFGWFVGVGEWFTVTRQGRVIVDITMHKTQHPGSPAIVALAASFAVAF